MDTNNKENTIFSADPEKAPVAMTKPGEHRTHFDMVRLENISFAGCNGGCAMFYGNAKSQAFFGFSITNENRCLNFIPFPTFNDFIGWLDGLTLLQVLQSTGVQNVEDFQISHGAMLNGKFLNPQEAMTLRLNFDIDTVPREAEDVG